MTPTYEELVARVSSLERELAARTAELAESRLSYLRALGAMAGESLADLGAEMDRRAKDAKPLTE